MGCGCSTGTPQSHPNAPPVPQQEASPKPNYTAPPPAAPIAPTAPEPAKIDNGANPIDR